MRDARFGAVAAALAALALTWWLAGCGGDDPAAPAPEPEPEPLPVVQLEGSLRLPEAWTGAPADLRVVDGLGSATCGDDGAFHLEVHEGHDQFAMVLGPDDGLVLLGWFGAGRTELTVRSTAEALVWLSLGAWMIGEDGGERVRALLAEPALDLAAVEAAWTAMLTAAPDGLAAPHGGLQAALQDAVDALVPGDSQGGKGLVIEPGAQQSGVEVLNLGGINTITVKNSYRRRAAAFLWRTGHRDTNGVNHLLAEPELVLETELPSVDGFGGTLNTILGVVTGGLAYEPVSLDPIVLDWRDDATRDFYRFNVLGMGRHEPDDPSRYSSYELAQGEWSALKCLVADYFLPMFLNTAGAAGTVAGSIFNDNIPGQVNDFISLVSGTFPQFHEQATTGQFWPALHTLWDAAFTNGTMQEWIRNLIAAGLRAARFTAPEAQSVIDGVNRVFFYLGIVDIIGNLADNMVTGYHFDLCKTAESWDLAVTSPVIHIEPRGALLMAYGTEHLRLVIDDDTGGTNPEGWAYAYRWRCDGTYGTLVNPVHPGDTSNDFITSSAEVDYVADVGEDGIETVFCELLVTLGGVETSIRETSCDLEVMKQHIVLPDTVFSCPRGRPSFSPVLEPPYEGTGTVVWNWRGGGLNGVLRGPAGETAPWTSTNGWAEFQVDSDGGDDTVLCVARILYENGTASAIDSTEVLVHTDVYQEISGSTYCRPRFQNIDGHCYCGYDIYVRFPEIPGINRYHVSGTGFNDPLYYGTSYETTVETRYLYREEGFLMLRLTWGNGDCDCADPPGADELCSHLWRFAGAVWEVTPVCP